LYLCSLRQSLRITMAVVVDAYRRRQNISSLLQVQLVGSTSLATHYGY
jgi:hypothetical protein